MKKFLAPEFENQLQDLVIENVPIKIPAQNLNGGRTLSGSSDGNISNNTYRKNSSGSSKF